jgi:rhamnogalacturonan endolyase
MDPDRPGLEVFSAHEKPSPAAGAEFRDAGTGRLLWGVASTGDVGRAVAMDIDPRHRGYECWAAGGGIGGLYNCRGVKISDARPRSCNFGAWWDGDLLRELLNGNRVSKWNWKEGSETVLLTAEGCTSNNGTKSTPALCADILGDWREEVLWRTADGKELRIYTTTIPTEHRLYTLMHDPPYRLSVAWQNVAYNQPAQPGFYLGVGLQKPPRPRITTPARVR